VRAGVRARVRAKARARVRGRVSITEPAGMARGIAMRTPTLAAPTLDSFASAPPLV
jgi:hypothetical protein